MKILIVKIAAIGDVVMALPLLTHIRTHHPKSHITWICSLQVKPFLQATQLVDCLIVVDEKALLKGNLATRFLAVLKIWIQLAMQAFDICLIAHTDPRYRLIALPIRCKEKRFWTRKKGRIIPVPGRYHADEYLRLFTGKDGPEAPPVIFPKINVSLKTSLQELLGSLNKKAIVVVAPGGAKNVLADDALRRWPILSYAALIKSFSDYPVHLLVTGSESDRWVIEHFKGIAYVNLIGKLDLLDMVALLKASQLLITHDSGPLHLAKLTECRTIALFGPTNPSEKVGSHEKIQVLWGGEHLACRPCYDGKTYAPCKRNDCLANITPQVVLNNALQLLEIASIETIQNQSYERCKKID